MFSAKKVESIKDIIRAIQSDRTAELEKDLEEKSDEEIIELVKKDLLDTDSTIIDRINMQKTGSRSTSTDEFVRGLSFYLFNILDNDSDQNNFLGDLEQLEKIKSLKPTIESVQKHIEEYKECEKKPRPPLRTGPAWGNAFS